MGTPIGDALERSMGLTFSDLAPNPHYAAHNNPKGSPAMSILDDLRTEVTNAESKAAEVWNHTKTALEQHLPAIEQRIAAVENEPFVKAYLGTQFAVPEHLVNVALSLLNALVIGNAAPAAPAADQAAAADPTAQQPAA